jgi:hypothetical protein
MNLGTKELVELISLIANVTEETNEFAYDKRKNQTSCVIHTTSLLQELGNYLESVPNYNEVAFDKELFFKSAMEMVRMKILTDNKYGTHSSWYVPKTSEEGQS